MYLFLLLLLLLLYCRDVTIVRLDSSELISIFLDPWWNEMPLQATCHDLCNSPLRSLAIFSVYDLCISVLQLSRASRCMVITEGSYVLI